MKTLIILFSFGVFFGNLSAQINETHNQCSKRNAFKNHQLKSNTLSVAQIEAIIRPCGLAPAKSKNIHRLSELLIELHGGVVPSSLEELEALPGVGHKTAGVVMIQAFGVPAFPVDTHIHRMMYRWGLSTGKSVEQTERDAKRLFPESTWIKLHLQIIFYAREYSPARGALPEKDFITMRISGKIKPLAR